MKLRNASSANRGTSWETRFLPLLTLDFGFEGAEGVGGTALGEADGIFEIAMGLRSDTIARNAWP